MRVVVALLVLVLAACSNAAPDAPEAAGVGDGASVPGVTETEIRVGGVASVTSPLGDAYEHAFTGAEAYFDLVNEQGGVHGRQLRLVAKRDDMTSPSRNAAAVRALVEEDNVFAVLPAASPSFQGGVEYLVDNRIPTFGWNINLDWRFEDNLFGEKGSYLCFDCPSFWLPWLAKQTGGTKVGIIAYGISHSERCAAGQRASFEKYGAELGIEVAFVNSSVPFGFTDLSADVERMRQAGVDFLSSCIDGAGNARLSRAVRQAGLEVIQYYPNGYDRRLLAEHQRDMEGVYLTTFFVPFEAADSSPGLQEFLAAMEERGVVPSEGALSGWINAHLLVAGLEAAGPDFDRESLVDAINEMTDYTADGILAGIDWTVQHDGLHPDSCVAYVQVQDGEFVPVFGEEGRPFVCHPSDAEELPPDQPETR